MKRAPIKKFPVLLLVVFTAINVHAQVNGYLGKRLIIGYHFISGINFDQIRNTSETGPYFLLKHEVNIDYITGKKTIVGLEGGYSTMSYSNIAPSFFPNPVGTSMDVKFFYYGLNIKRFFSSSPDAPVGGYIKFKAGILEHTYSITEVQNNKPIVSTTPSPQYSSQKYIGFGYGKMRVYHDWLILDMGIELNFFPGSGSNFIPLLDGQKNLLEDTEKETMHRIAQNSLINYYIGIEGLLGRSHK